MVTVVYRFSSSADSMPSSIATSRSLTDTSSQRQTVPSVPQVRGADGPTA